MKINSRLSVTDLALQNKVVLLEEEEKGFFTDTDYKSSLIRPVADRLSPVGPCFLNPSGFRHRVY